MNFSVLTGLAIAGYVLWQGVIAHATKPSIFLDTHAMILVLGGTVAAGFIGFPMGRFVDLFRFLAMGVLYPMKLGRLKVAKEVLQLAAVMEEAVAREEVTVPCHPFLGEGYRLLRRGNLKPDEFKRVLAQRNGNFRQRYLADAKMLTALAKFPPAFGLLGATTGMIAMMSNLGSSGQDSIGPAMAIALVATFWGIALANFVLLPLADHAAKLADDQTQLRTMMMAGLVLLQQRSEARFLYEMMQSYLPVDQRDSYELIALKDAVERAHSALDKTVVSIDSHRHDHAHNQGANPKRSA